MAAHSHLVQLDLGPVESAGVISQEINTAKDRYSTDDPTGEKVHKFTSSPVLRSSFAAGVKPKPVRGSYSISGELEEVVDRKASIKEGHPVKISGCRKSPGRRPEALDQSAVTKKAKVTQDEVVSQDDDLSPIYNPDSEGDDHLGFVLDSPSTLQNEIENARKEHMARATHALKYYHSNHTRHPDDAYYPVHVNLKHVIFMMDIMGYYIHMNFTAENLRDQAQNIFFAELHRSYENHTDEWVVTACDIVGPESLGGLRHVWRPNGILFTGDTKDVKNCYACNDVIKHIDGSMYEAGHRGHDAYESSDISVE